MKTLLWLLGEIILFGVISFASKKIKNFQFYYGCFLNTKYPLFDLISFKEKVAYYITKVVKETPTFSFAPSDYEFWRVESEKEEYCSQGEKRWLTLSLLLLHIRSVVGNVLIDAILIVTFLTCEDFIKWKKVWDFIIGIVRDFPIKDIGKELLEGLDWIQENINVFLIIVIVMISVNLGFLKRKKRRYSIEAVWAEEDKERIKKVAKIQKSIEQELLEIRDIIYQNLEFIKEEIRCCNYTKEEEIRFDRLIDYKDKSNEIKSLLWKINEIEGIPIYAKRNRRMYIQLTLLGLLPSLVDIRLFIELDRMSKDYIEHKCKSKEQLCRTYAYGVGLMNGINRFLEFSYKKRNQYNRIVLHIADSDYIGKIFEKVK